MRHRAEGLAILVGLWSILVVATTARVRADDELDTHLATLRSQMQDHSLAIERREEIALEMAAALDRAAQGAATVEAKRVRWSQAIALIDGFGKANAGHPRARQFQSQAAVYLWARARLWADQCALSPTDREACAHAIENLDVAIARLRTLNEALGRDNSVLAQNVRFRLAQALADRAGFDAEGTDARRAKDREAVDALERPVNEPALQGFAHLLRAELHARLGDEAEAESALRAAAKAVPAPPAAAWLEARVAVLLGQERFAEAIEAIDGARGDAPLRALLAVRVRLAQRHTLTAKPARAVVEADLFRRIGPLRTSAAPEAKLALIALARGLNEPDAGGSPADWSAVAEGAVALGDLARASSLVARGAERADAIDAPEQAAALRLRAGALLFQAGKFLEADAPLSRVAGDAKAAAARPKAALLRALARGRALALRLPGASQSSYASALEAMIRDFPADPSTSEARWLLGKLRLATAARAEALALWAAIPRSAPRWTEAQLAAAAMRQENLDTERIRNERPEVLKRYEEARTSLETTLGQCRSASERAAVELSLARLELTPDVGHAEDARRSCERIVHSASQAEQRDGARRLHLVAMAELNHFVEAEQEARAEVERTGPADLLETARLLDHIALESQSDLRMRRFGLILRVLLDRIVGRDDALPPAERAEARLRQVRALLLSGDDDRARATLASWPGPPPAAGDRLLKDLADTYARLNAYDLAADVHRLRAQHASTGSLPWFEARYGLALAYYRAGKEKDAGRVIDATAILHPDLGGGELHDKFVHLRQRLDPGQ